MHGRPGASPVGGGSRPLSQDGDLELRLGRHALVGPEQAEDAADDEVEDGPDHGGALSEGGPASGCGRRSGFWTPRVRLVARFDRRLVRC